MKEEQIQTYMNELLRYVPTVVHSESIMKNHLRYMRFFSDWEWFNILSVLYCLPTAVNAKTVDAWNKTFDKQIFVKRGQKGLLTLLPVKAGNGLQWTMAKVFDISQLATTIVPAYASPLQARMSKCKVDSLNDLFASIVDDAMDADRGCAATDGNMREYVRCCITIAFADLLDGKQAVSWVDLEDGVDNVEAYQAVKRVIERLPDCLEEAVVEAEAKEQKRQEIEKAMRIQNSCIQERIARAKDILNDRLQPQTDGSDRDALQARESNWADDLGLDDDDTGIPEGAYSDDIVYDEEDWL